MVELGLYESSAKTYASLAEKGLQPGTPEWDAGVHEVLDRQSTAMAQRLDPAIPAAKYLCFYLMDRKRAETANWYTQPMAERQRMMHEHVLIGRRYVDSVRQIITGSIGFDDWEWGRRSFRRRSSYLQKTHLRDEIRPSERSLCPIR
jgi:peroxiredoxin